MSVFAYSSSENICFNRRLAVVEIALHRHDVDVGALLRAHLQLLHLGYAVVGVEHHNLYALGVFEPLERGLAGVARSGDEYEYLFLYAADIAAPAQKIGQHRERHVLERAGGAVPQFEQVDAVVYFYERGGVAFELGIRRLERGEQLLAVVVVEVFAQYLRRPFGVAQRQHRLQLLPGYGRETFGNEQSAVVRKALYYSFCRAVYLFAAARAYKIHNNFLPKGAAAAAQNDLCDCNRKRRAGQKRGAGMSRAPFRMVRSCVFAINSGSSSAGQLHVMVMTMSLSAESFSSM